MASSNRHWPSLFKSKPCTTHPHHPWQHDVTHSPLLSSAAAAAPPASCQKAPYTAGLGEGGERSPEPKPRWNPKQEQIRILEAIFNSGMVNPPRDEIRRIRARLQEYGQVGDANVFYWFQNRKSRSKHRQRHHPNTPAARQQLPRAPAPPVAFAPAAAPLAASSSSSSSSERSTGSDRSKIPPPLASVGFTAASPTASVNQIDQTNHNFQSPAEFFVENIYNSSFTGSQSSAQGFCLSTELPQDFVSAQDQGINGLVPGMWTELMMGFKCSSEGSVVEVSKINGNTTLEQNPNPNSSTAAAATPSVTNDAVEMQGGVGGGAARSTVFFNGVGFDVAAGQFINVRDVFGESAVLIHASGHPVLTDEWGRTLHPLQHGASYFLV